MQAWKSLMLNLTNTKAIARVAGMIAAHQLFRTQCGRRLAVLSLRLDDIIDFIRRPQDATYSSVNAAV